MAIETERPLQIAGAINAYCALLAKDAGFRAIYLSGAGVANASFGLPDLASPGSDSSPSRTPCPNRGPIDHLGTSDC